MAFVPFSARTTKVTVADQSPLTLTEQVQRVCMHRQPNLIAFKVIPNERMPTYLRYNVEREDQSGRGTMFMMSGGLLGTMVVRDLAAITSENMVSSCDWAMPDGCSITSVAVHSKGDAEQYPADLLLLEHAPDLAVESVGAHVFHFFDEDQASLFQGFLCMEIQAHQAERN